MPKIKTNKATSKRFKLTGKGRVKRTRSSKSHILTKKSRKRKRGLRRKGIVFKGEERTIKRLLPYG